MATVMRKNGWRFVIYSDDHPPPHVHVKRPGGDLKVSLPRFEQPVSVLRVRNLATHEAMRAVRLVEENRQLLLLAWEEIHG
jgi:hypothetical protein